ncbi:MAG: TetR/AcrR family transcriptional regulator [Acidobacteria bacterium]|nr:TetR/AcrR family transcriptional regulator [Acidobacteriota bacterium]MCB9397997.1 TetR/AcrR family transcriptional regulator [Acidobacteriota bacterium]
MGQKRQDILEAAQQLFQNKGFRATSMQDIANTAGLSKGALYLHFPSKQALTLAVLAMIDENLRAEIIAIKNHPQMLAREKMRAQLVFQFRDVMENRAFNEMILKEFATQLDDAFLEFLDRAREAWQVLSEDFLLLLYGEKIKSFVIDLAVILNGILHEYHTLIILDGLDIDLNRVVDFLMLALDQVAEGLSSLTFEPVLQPEMLANRSARDARIQNESRIQALEWVTQMQQRVGQFGLDYHQRLEVQESLQIMATNLATESPNRVLLQGMLANLVGLKPFEDFCQKMAASLKLRLPHLD